MPNTLGHTNGRLIARRSLESALEQYPALRLMTMDCSDEEAYFNQPVSVKVPEPMEADDYDGGDEGEGYEEQEVSQIDVPFTIDQHIHVTYGFNDTERSSHDVGLIERFGRNAGHAIGKRFMDELCALVVAAKFPNAFESGAETFEKENVGDVREKINLRKLPLADRYMILNSAFYKNLSKETVLVANPGSPSETVRTGMLGKVEGFETVEFPFLDDNGEGLGGFAGIPEGLIIATRVPTMPDKKSLGGGSIEIVTEPTTGISMQVRSWYDFKKGKEFRTYTIMFGVAAGPGAYIERIKTP